eukprot:350730-Chlamydomonas_euryale.AAC.8
MALKPYKGERLWKDRGRHTPTTNGAACVAPSAGEYISVGLPHSRLGDHTPPGSAGADTVTCIPDQRRVALACLADRTPRAQRARQRRQTRAADLPDSSPDPFAPTGRPAYIGVPCMQGVHARARGREHRGAARPAARCIASHDCDCVREGDAELASGKPRSCTAPGDADVLWRLSWLGPCSQPGRSTRAVEGKPRRQPTTTHRTSRTCSVARAGACALTACLVTSRSARGDGAQLRTWQPREC